MVPGAPGPGVPTSSSRSASRKVCRSASLNVAASCCSSSAEQLAKSAMGSGFGDGLSYTKTIQWSKNHTNTWRNLENWRMIDVFWGMLRILFKIGWGYIYIYIYICIYIYPHPMRMSDVCFLKRHAKGVVPKYLKWFGVGHNWKRLSPENVQGALAIFRKRSFGQMHLKNSQEAILAFSQQLKREKCGETDIKLDRLPAPVLTALGSGCCTLGQQGRFTCSTCLLHVVFHAWLRT